MTIVYRCPFCHEAVSRTDGNVQTCAGCLALHHTACWGEHGGCSGCGSSVAFEARSTVYRALTERLVLGGLLFAVAMAGLVAWASTGPQFDWARVGVSDPSKESESPKITEFARVNVSAGMDQSGGLQTLEPTVFRMGAGLEAREVVLSRQVFMRRAPVTSVDYVEFCRATNRVSPHLGFSSKYIANVSWFEAKAFCLWAGGRLLTDAEWECAFRTKKSMEFTSGEWVEDWYGALPPGGAIDPVGPSSGRCRIVRNNTSWGKDLESERFGAEPDSRWAGVGFRVAFDNGSKAVAHSRACAD